MIHIGDIEKLKIKKIVEIGAYLVNEDGDEILLPRKQVPRDSKVSDEIEVFLYNDSKSRPIATVKRPLIKKGEITKLTCIDINKIGAFLDMGLERDLFLPYAQMTGEVKKGDSVLVTMYVDKSNRLCASMKIKNFDTINTVDANNIKQIEYDHNAEKVLKIINTKYGGHLLKTDKDITAQETIEIFSMSKNKFKNAIGKLLKEDKIKITKQGIYVY